MRPTLLGMARGDGMRGPPLLPSKNGGTTAADRLLAMSGMDHDEFIRNFRRQNILPNGHWAKAEARVRGYRLRKKLKGRIIVLGKETWRALWLPRLPFFTHVWVGDTEFVLVPHPSGRCLEYNRPIARKRLRNILQGYE